MGLPELSIVVIARNEEAHIARCLDAVTAAADVAGSCETVLVDSASADRTLEIAARYPIRIVRLGGSERPTAAMGRHVGARLTQAPYVVFVDGDSVIEPAWVVSALRLLRERSRVAAIAGREAQVYYRDGVVIGGRADYFETGDVERVVEQLGGNGMYRRQALEAVGSFNPYVRSFEEAELGARLRQAGWTLVRMPAPMAEHHTPVPDSRAEYWRRLRNHLLTGQGQVLRLALRQGLFWEHARRLNRVLGFLLWTVLGLLAVSAGAIAGARGAAGLWLLASAALLLAFVVRSRSFVKPARLVFDWAVSAPGLAWGFLLPPRDATSFRPEQVVLSDSGEVPRRAGVGGE